MISNISNQNNKPLTMPHPSFKGDKDILVIDDTLSGMSASEVGIKTVLADKVDEYVIHRAKGGKEGLKKAKEVKPFFTVTAYNMPGLGPDAGELIRKLKQIGTKVIVNTLNWYGQGDISRKAGVETCENYYGADKYVYQFDKDMFQETVKAMVEGKDLPMYPFQSDKASKVPSSSNNNQNNNWFTRLLNIFRNS